jgi:hypothetical protein
MPFNLEFLERVEVKYTWKPRYDLAESWLAMVEMHIPETGWRWYH